MNIAIVGFGIEGQASYSYWSNKKNVVTIVDQNEDVSGIPNGARSRVGDGVLDDLSQFDMVIRTPQINPGDIHQAKKIWSATNEFFKVCPAPIIGVTGTKGKGTTSSLIARILESAGETVHLLGNIGRPALSVLPEISVDDIVIFELSSFQLWDLQYSPQTAVVLMIEADHLNVHADMQEYVNAKKRIGLQQSASDSMVYHPTNPYSLEIASASKAHKVRYLTNEGAHIIDEEVVIEKTNVCKIKDIQLIGAHNVENVCAAITASWRYTQNIPAIRTAVQQFTGLPHRLEFIKTISGVDYYNDSYSSTPAATVAAVRSFTGPITLLVGGYDKNSDFRLLKKQLNEQDNISNIIIYGAVRHKMARALSGSLRAIVHVLETNDFRRIITAAQDYARPGGVVILSPGTSSFDMFKNFEDRGEQFKRIIEEIS